MALPFLKKLQQILTDLRNLRRPVVFVALGDSSVEGIGATTPNRSFPALVSLFVKLSHKNVKFFNLGQRGACVKDVLTNQLPKAIDLQPDIVLISAGANDIRKITPLLRLEKNFANLLWQLNDKTGAKIIVNGLPDMASTPKIPLFAKPFCRLLVIGANRIIQKQTKAIGGLYVDLFDQSKIFKDYQEFVSDDGFHPSDAGYALWANTIISHLEGELKKPLRH